jgi:alkaline phosphatase
MSASDFDEDDALRHPGQLANVGSHRKWVAAAVTIALVAAAVAGVTLATVLTVGAVEQGQSKVVVLMLGDGFGPASVSLLRAYLNHTGVRNRLFLDDYLVGSVQTASLDSRITDSAAGATAYACGMRTFNDWVGTLSSGRACGTVAEAAKRRGMRVGLVSKTAITNASPAAFSAHARSRVDEQFIASQQIKTGFDVMLGGGQSQYGFRYGGTTSPIDQARARGYTIVQTRAQLAAATAAPVLGLFASKNLDYAIDRPADSTQPTLPEMATEALRLLRAADTDKRGIFLFVEGSFIDLAGHSNDAATQVRESREYDDTFKLMVDLVAKSGGTVISLADHATGGLALGRNFPGPSYPDPYLFFVRRLERAQSSVQQVASRIVSGRVFPFASLVNATLAFDLSPQQETALRVWADAGDVTRLTVELAELIGAADYISWSSWGHDAVDVGLYCAGNCPSESFRGSLRNDVVGQQLAQLLGVQQQQLDATIALADFNTTGHHDGWTGAQIDGEL